MSHEDYIHLGEFLLVLSSLPQLLKREVSVKSIFFVKEIVTCLLQIQKEGTAARTEFTVCFRTVSTFYILL